MKILVFGASGMAGHIITLYFREQGYDVTGFTRRPITYCKNILGDATNPADVKEALENDDFDIVIMLSVSSICLLRKINQWL